MRRHQGTHSLSAPSAHHIYTVVVLLSSFHRKPPPQKSRAPAALLDNTYDTTLAVIRRRTRNSASCLSSRKHVLTFHVIDKGKKKKPACRRAPMVCLMTKLKLLGEGNTDLVPRRCILGIVSGKMYIFLSLTT